MEGSGFTGSSTAEEVTKGVDASGLTAIVTGATAGIGTETARVLALRGAHVYLTGRSVKSAKETNEAILKDLPDAKLDILAPLDLCSQASGAATTVYVALHPSVKGVSGKFFVDSNEFDPKVYHPLAEDEQESKKCWDLGVQLTST